MTILPLAVGIADAILNASREDSRFDPAEVANELMRQHPSANVSPDDIVSTLREEGRSVGLCLEAC
ncbi:hypothetical protein ACFOEZ_07235 [Tianweitania populi]|uniref:Uncharacterized protein n=1 Tax=Tianweitania populi TaxID=1607949 RepID=A0A8J3GJ44_9HYPH|nr:hypothetical protein [Tianweitania populi]GHD10644.1 hypothetical protein GCM10016234_12740 [Tianweitania populi]